MADFSETTEEVRIGTDMTVAAITTVVTITTVAAITTAPGITSTDDTRRVAADTLTAATIRVATCPVPQKKGSTALYLPSDNPSGLSRRDNSCRRNSLRRNTPRRNRKIPRFKACPSATWFCILPKITATFSRLSTIFACMSPQSWSLQGSATKTDNVFWTF